MKRIEKRIIKRCSGCRACESVCPQKCIKILHDRMDYFESSVDSSKCIKCGLCKKVCPQLNPPRLSYPMAGYIACCSDYSLGKRSSSGGIAACIYDYCLRSNIKCIGTAFDNNMALSYRYIDRIDDIRCFSGSKYVYSDMGNMYSSIRKELELGNRIVFIGMPCHVAGLINFFGEEEQDVILVEIMCDALTMPGYFENHIAYIENITGSRVSNARFRDMDNNYGLTTTDAMGRVIYRENRYSDEYMLAFTKEIGYCSACYKCPYATTRRCADMTIMDCSMANNERSGIRAFFRASNIMIHSMKGMRFWNELVEVERIKWEDYPIDKIVKSQPRMNHPAKGVLRNRVLYYLTSIASFERAVRIMYPITRILNEIGEN